MAAIGLPTEAYFCDKAAIKFEVKFAQEKPSEKKKKTQG
jgi:hypothetical protein